jgi:hypothetical protein
MVTVVRLQSNEDQADQRVKEGCLRLVEGLLLLALG